MDARPLRVILVEDSPDDAELVELELIRGGFSPTLLRVETAEDMRTGLQRGPWDLVLSDFNLPAFSAAGALETLQASGLDLPFIIMSGMVRAEEAVKLMKRGAHDFIDKAALARLVPAIERELRDAGERARRRAAEEQVRVLSMVVEQSPVSVVVTNTEGLMTYVNPCFRDTSGYGPAEVLGQPPSILRADAASGETYDDIWHTIQAGQVWRGTLHNCRKDGSSYWEEAAVSPVRDLDGRVSHYVGILRDVTERMARDQELRQAVEHLTRVNTELERFAYVASHDLQEPLRTLTSFTQLLERRLGGDMDAEAQEYMTFIIDAARRMHTLINDLLAYSRIATEEKGFVPVSMHEACAAAIRNLKSSIDDAGALVTIGELPQVMGDEIQLMQLFQNLIGNAVKFRKPGVTPTVVVETKRDDAEWRISVSDNGIGLSATSQDIFEIFRRLHNPSEYPGTGVGLAICKCIVQRHKGRIWVESEPGQGCTFFFTLPVTGLKPPEDQPGSGLASALAR
ncbi:hypothetical protein A6A04_00565 [Paramagnetospirillum marisnigri]|uniref:histidine kinase n=1 Tax=Paramagnetospirillum marisnigri TaxID=1285242 RepID=A0A178MTY9_9PROT|nr:ATP-binding protein [Paramagnetospirillum marisnigri]OAN52224.1 hypothetical protein A6A04_00565 [Paramagnetospirillum marisnigri]